MSSSSSDSNATAWEPAQPVTIGALLAESFRIIQAELPSAYAGLVEALSQLKVRIEVDAESLEVGGSEREMVWETAGASPCETRIATSSATILAVLDARLSLQAAVLDGRLRVIAELASVEGLHQALLCYTHAAVRCPGFPALFARFRSLACARAEAAS